MYLLIKFQSNYASRMHKETSQAAAGPNAARDTVETGHGMETKPTDSLDSVNEIQVCFLFVNPVESKSIRLYRLEYKIIPNLYQVNFRA